MLNSSPRLKSLEHFASILFIQQNIHWAPPMFQVLFKAVVESGWTRQGLCHCMAQILALGLYVGTGHHGHDMIFSMWQLLLQQGSWAKLHTFTSLTEVAHSTWCLSLALWTSSFMTVVYHWKPQGHRSSAPPAACTSTFFSDFASLSVQELSLRCYNILIKIFHAQSE